MSWWLKQTLSYPGRPNLNFDAYHVHRVDAIQAAILTFKYCIITINKFYKRSQIGHETVGLIWHLHVLFWVPIFCHETDLNTKKLVFANHPLYIISREIFIFMALIRIPYYGGNKIRLLCIPAMRRYDSHVQFPGQVISKHGITSHGPLGPPDLTVCNIFLFGLIKST